MRKSFWHWVGEGVKRFFSELCPKQLIPLTHPKGSGRPKLILFYFFKYTIKTSCVFSHFCDVWPTHNLGESAIFYFYAVSYSICFHTFTALHFHTFECKVKRPVLPQDKFQEATPATTSAQPIPQADLNSVKDPKVGQDLSLGSQVELEANKNMPTLSVAGNFEAGNF